MMFVVALLSLFTVQLCSHLGELLYSNSMILFSEFTHSDVLFCVYSFIRATRGTV